MLTLLGTLIVVTFTAWLNTRSVHAMIEGLRQTMRGDLQKAFTRASWSIENKRLTPGFLAAQSNGKILIPSR